jgi:EAL domain-containing protein (putative c-di-GMP-specific phosphodiesterase class I)
VQSLKLKSIAEGVKCAAQMHIRRDLGCHEIQGYFYNKPLLFDGLKDFPASDEGLSLFWHAGIAN